MSTSVIICKDAFKKDAHQFEMKFDSIIIATGSETNTFGVAGVLGNEHVFFLKQLIDSRNIRNRLIDCFERASSPGADLDEINRLLTFVIVGGGPTSVEFAAELYDFLKKDVSRLYPDLHKHCQVKLVEASGNILGSFQHSLVGYVDKLFHSRNIKVLTNTAVKSVDAYTATLSDGNQISFGLMVWSTGIKQVPFVEQIDSTRVMKNRGGRLEIDSRLRLLGVTNGSSSTRDLIQSSAPVFAIGDCAADATKPLPALAQVASQQAVHLASTLNNLGIDRVWNGESEPFAYKHLGSMASVGEWKGVFDSSNIGAQSGNSPAVKGFLAFALWRAAYWTKQVSITNKILILMYWFKTAVFGRDISRF